MSIRKEVDVAYLKVPLYNSPKETEVGSKKIKIASQLSQIPNILLPNTVL